MSSFGDLLEGLKNSVNAEAEKIKADIPSISNVAKSDSDLTKKDDAFVTQIKKIAEEAQNTFNITGISGKGLMGRGLKVDIFSSEAKNRWYKSYPYSLIVYSLDDTGKYNLVAKFSLPINPQDMTISMNPAVKVTATSRGILEEHNGVIFKQISLNGTTGILLKRETETSSSKPQSVVGTLFGGTIAATGSAISSLQSNIDKFGSLLNEPKKKSDSETDVKSDVVMSGYYQYHMLRIFLETYLEAKKGGEGKALRLAFAMPKDKIEYLVTPVNFTTKRSAASPMEYNYSLTLTAWGTVPPGDQQSEDAKPKSLTAKLSDDISKTQKVINSIRDFRTTASRFRAIIDSVKSDFNSNIVGPINDVILVAKDIASVAVSLDDLPESLKQSMNSSIIDKWGQLSNVTNEIKDRLNSKINQIKLSSSGSNSSSFSMSSSATNTTVSGAAVLTKTLSQDYIKSEVLNQPGIMDNISPSDLNLSTQQQTAIESVRQNALNTTNENKINLLISNLKDLNKALEPIITTLPPLEPEWDLLYSIQDTITNLYSITSNGFSKETPTETNNANSNPSAATNVIDYWNQNLQNNNVNFQSPTAKIYIPFPFRGTLEQLAANYLGDATRWGEIAALNGLQSPYIDEDGFYRNLVVNGNTNDIIVDSAKDLFVGQTIYISSDTQQQTKRKIQKISEVSSKQFIITVDGSPNMGNYTSSDNAKMKAYLPYTVNSMMQIAIPVQGSPTEESQTKSLPFLKDDLESVSFSKVDILLDPNYDLAITSDGFANLAYGKTNLIQAAKLKLATVPGTVILNPEYGAGIELGGSTAELGLESQIKKISQSFEQDSRFSSPSNISFKIDGSTLVMELTAIVKKDGSILPVSFNLT